MKKYFGALLLVALTSLPALSQVVPVDTIASDTTSVKEHYFGYISFTTTMEMMPEYMEAQLSLQRLSAEYKSELDRARREFDRQYTDFMVSQDQLSMSIVVKRQKELQLIMDNNIKFKNEINRELESARNSLLDPLRRRVMETIAEVCRESGYDYVVDIDQMSFLYINPDRGVDITPMVYSRLGISTITTSEIELGQSEIVQ